MGVEVLMDGSAALILRPPGTVMRLARMGTFHATRLSFLRVLLRRLGEDGWTADRPVWELNEQGVGLVYKFKARCGIQPMRSV